LGAQQARWYRRPLRVCAAPAGRTIANFHETTTTIEACSVANIKSQIKRNRQNDAAHERNKSVKSALKSAVRKFREAADAGNADEARALAAAAGRKLDKAASAGVIHKNQAANRKSAINKRAASL
jgi:small subunit ribosomal protein S20